MFRWMVKAHDYWKVPCMSGSNIDVGLLYVSGPALPDDGMSRGPADPLAVAIAPARAHDEHRWAHFATSRWIGSFDPGL